MWKHLQLRNPNTFQGLGFRHGRSSQIFSSQASTAQPTNQDKLWSISFIDLILVEKAQIHRCSLQSKHVCLQGEVRPARDTALPEHHGAKGLCPEPKDCTLHLTGKEVLATEPFQRSQLGTQLGIVSVKD